MRGLRATIHTLEDLHRSMVATIEWGYAKSSDRKPVRCKPLPGQPLLEARSEGGSLSPSFWCEMPINTGRSSAEPDRMPPSCDSRSTILPGCLLLRDLGQIMHHYPQPTHRPIPSSPWWGQRSRLYPLRSTLMRPSMPALNAKALLNHRCRSYSLRFFVGRPL